jgi:putative tricarboxylic transport membrane protein
MRPEPVEGPSTSSGRIDSGTDDAAEPPARTRRWGEVAMTGLLLVIGVYLILDAGRIAIPGSTNTVGPRFFPYLVGGATVLVAVLLGLRILRGDQGPEEDSEDIDPTAPTSWRAVGIIAVAFLAHALLINVVGWPLAVTSMFGVVAWSLGARGILRPLLAGAITSVVIWLLFVKALRVVLPGGILLELATSWI